MEWWAYLLPVLGACVVLRYTIFAAPEHPAEILDNESVTDRIKRYHSEEEKRRVKAVENKLNISLDLLEFERKKARAERVQEVYAGLVEKIKRLNLEGQRQLDAGHPGSTYQSWERNLTRDIQMMRLRNYPLPLSESEMAEIGESNGVGEEVATMLRRNGIGVDTSGKMAHTGSIFDRDRHKNRMIITW